MTAARCLAAASAACALLAGCYLVVGLYNWNAAAGLLCAAIAFGWCAADVARLTRAQQERTRDRYVRAVDSWDGRDPDPNERSLAA